MKTEDRLERDLKDLFAQAVENEPPLAEPLRGSTWTFSGLRGALRGLRGAFAPAMAKGFATASLAGAVAVGALVVGPKVLDDTTTTDDGTTLVQPGGQDDPTSPRPTPATSPKGGSLAAAAPTTAYRDERIGFALRYPSAWQRYGSGALGKDYVAFVSHEDWKRGFEMWEQDGSCDPCPLAVPVQLVNFAEHDEYVRLMGTVVAKWRRQGVEVTESRTRIAGRATRTYHVAWPDRPSPDGKDQEWCRGCVGDWYLVPWYQGTTLDVRVMGLNAAVYAELGDHGRAIARSLRDIGPPKDRLTFTPPVIDPTPDPDPTVTPAPAPQCRLRHGSIMSSIKCDWYTDAMLEFAAARIDGSDAEAWLSGPARSQYDEHSGGLWLYTPEGERAYESYFITERVTDSTGRIRFTVEMNQGYVGETGDRIRVEHVWVGPGQPSTGEARRTPNPNVVTDAELIAEPTEP